MNVPLCAGAGSSLLSVVVCGSSDWSGVACTVSAASDVMVSSAASAGLWVSSVASVAVAGDSSACDGSGIVSLSAAGPPFSLPVS